MTFKDEIEKIWTIAGGLIQPAIAAKILNVSRSVITKRTDIKKYKIDDNIFVSFAEVMGKTDIHPRKKKKDNENAK